MLTLYDDELRLHDRRVASLKWLVNSVAASDAALEIECLAQDADAMQEKITDLEEQLAGSLEKIEELEDELYLIKWGKKRVKTSKS